MGMNFDQFKRSELGKLKRRVEKARSYKRIQWVILILLLLTFFLGIKLLAESSNLFKDSKLWFVGLALFLLALFSNSFTKKTDKISLSPKEEILFHISQAQIFLREFYSKKERPELNKAIKSFSKIADSLEKININKNGFTLEEPLNTFLDKFLIFLNYYIQRNLQIDLSDDKYWKIDNLLLNIFITIQDEEFEKALKIVSFYTKDYHQPKKRLMSFIGQIKESPSLRILFFILLIFISDGIIWGMFRLMSYPYSHYWGLPIIVVIVFGLKKEIESIIYKF